MPLYPPKPKPGTIRNEHTSPNSERKTQSHGALATERKPTMHEDSINRAIAIVLATAALIYLLGAIITNHTSPEPAPTPTPTTSTHQN